MEAERLQEPFIFEKKNNYTILLLIEGRQRETEWELKLRKHEVPVAKKFYLNHFHH